MSEQLPSVLESVFREIPNLAFEEKGARRLRVKLRADTLPALLELLKGRAGYLHLSAISCVDWPTLNEFELVYHLWSYEIKTLISAHIYIPKVPGRYVSVYDIYTPAAFFERDIHEMFGVYFDGSPDMEPFILTEWEGPPPMLKSFSTVDYVEKTFKWQDYSPLVND
ncbi:MAG: NADH-quinone oxidoreductase subunit C [Gammaproteobacteria bacterium]|nr:MAG: NADH-quinone oxidoreductase subunit C [Gammaproteobacteria bacterium]RKZ41487.1 MAG: NADH-quinone oxidoreductase subunit C [Gammaproteobacteria bacterium]RKZ73633.1 MAG: NADH-quinone oxidoreductase subunit C [Gammaproteobacteria bacterium]